MPESEAAEPTEPEATVESERPRKRKSSKAAPIVDVTTADAQVEAG